MIFFCPCRPQALGTKHEVTDHTKKKRKKESMFVCVGPASPPVGKSDVKAERAHSTPHGVMRARSLFFYFFKNFSFFFFFLLIVYSHVCFDFLDGFFFCLFVFLFFEFFFTHTFFLFLLFLIKKKKKKEEEPMSFQVILTM